MRQFLRRNFFWLSYFDEDGKKKAWVSKTSLLIGSISLISGWVFLLFLYLTVGAAVKLSATLYFGALNYALVFFLSVYIFLLAAVGFFFFKDILSGVKVEYDGDVFYIKQPISVKKYVNIFFMNESRIVRSKLSSIVYSKALFDIFSEDAEYYYSLDFMFADGEKVRYPFIYTSSDLISYFVERSTTMNVKFGHFTLDEVKKIAGFFSCPTVYAD